MRTNIDWLNTETPEELFVIQVGKLYRYHHASAKGERMYSSYSFFTSALVGSEWSASRPGRAIQQGKDPGAHV
jgi:hypothetical protein